MGRSLFKAPMRMRIYLSGPITSLGTDRARMRFDVVKRDLQHLGNDVVTPFDNGLPDTAPYEQHMAKDFELLSACNAVCMLRGWQQSPGAKREFDEAVRQNKIIFYENIYKRR